jgi:fermentation-respiration switch protein FrsA (DUF1100 family)
MSVVTPPVPTPSAAAPRWKRRLRRWFVLGLVVYAGQLVLLLLLENRLVFPAAGPSDWHPATGATVTDVDLTTADGTPLHAWHFPNPEARLSVLFLHGNAGNVSYRGRLVSELARALGVSALIVDYPGYGRSGGSPSEAGCYAAADAGYDWLTKDQKVPADRLIILGESLGGGVAVDLASRRDHRALVLMNTFGSLPDAAAARYFWLPVRALMRNQFDSAAKIGGCRRPIFQAHGTEDWIVPFASARRLFDAAPGPKRFLELPGHGHNDPWGVECVEAMRQFLDDLTPPP